MSEVDQVLLRSLEREFCPPLDTALFMALVNDVQDLNSEQQLDALRETLQSLACAADIPEQSGDDSSGSIKDDAASTTKESSSATSLTSFTSDSPSDNDQDLTFLQAALPHVSLDRLMSSLSTTGPGTDMWDAISTILTEDWILELEERGLDGLSDDEDVITPSSPRFTPVTSQPKRKKAQPTSKIVLGDVRQQHQVRSPSATPAPVLDDPWSQISSISTYLSQLLPPHPVSFFSSYFHNPSHVTPYSALCAALAHLASASKANDDSIAVLQINLSEILTSIYPEIAKLEGELRLALLATGGKESESLELVHLLRDLDDDSVKGEFGMGVYHSSAQSTPTPPPLAEKPPDSMKTRPSSNLTTTPSSPSQRRLPASKSTNKPSPYQWQKVPERKAPRGPHPHAAYIPSYSSSSITNGHVKGAGNRFGKGGKGDVGELGRGGRGLMAPSMQKRDELLRKAADAWRKGGTIGGGDVALYYAEEARKAQRDGEREMLDAARVRIEKKRLSTGEVDLHGTTVNEAITIVREILAKERPTSDKPLRIITGRGSHSANHTSVLKPALKTELGKDGKWNVRAWDGGLNVWVGRRT